MSKLAVRLAVVAVVLAALQGASFSASAAARSQADAGAKRHKSAQCVRRSRRCEGGIPLNRSRLPRPKPAHNIGGATPPDMYVPFATGSRVVVSQGPQAPCGRGFTHAPTACNGFFGPFNQWAWDFAVPVGTPVRAATGGTVVRAGVQGGGYGFTVVVRTPRGDCARYQHLQAGTIAVRVGQPINVYDLLARSGATGNVTGPHLHFGREDCRTSYSLPSSFLDVGTPGMGATVTSGNRLGGGGPAPPSAPVLASCPPNCNIYGASAGVNVRKAPALGAAVLRTAANGSGIRILCQTRGDSVGGSTVWDQIDGGGYVADYYVNTPVTGAYSPGISECPAPEGPGPPTTSPPTQSPQPAPVDRYAVTSYDRMAPGAPYHAYFNNAWQPFAAKSNTITQIAATVGNPGLTAGATVPFSMTLRICANQPDPAGACTVVAQAQPQITNYGATAADVGDVAVTPGATYWIEWFQPPPANGKTWVTFWWAGGPSIGASDQMQAFAKGYNR